MTSEPLRVLIVDDSRIFRGVIEQALSDNHAVKVIGSVWSGDKALEFVRVNPTDFVTLDLQMPGLSGLETLKLLREIPRNRQHPLGVLLISSLTQRGAAATIEGLQEGAFDFITKPDGPDAAVNFIELKEQLNHKLSLYLQRPRRTMIPAGTALDPVRVAPYPHSPVATLSSRPALNFQAVVIGSSTGGPEALCQILPLIVRQSPVPLFLVQHLPVGLTSYFAASLERRCGCRVIEAQAGMIPKGGELYVAPAGQHLVLEWNGEQVCISLSHELPENGCRPSADVLFRTASNAYRGRVLGVVLTGMGSDGSRGAVAIKQAGGYVIVQNEATSVVWGMPGSTIAAGGADEVLPLGIITSAVRRMLRMGGESV